MNHNYSDILALADRAPNWFDEHAVPRFDSFAPDRIANIYSSECALVLIVCQGCGTEFKVAFSEINATGAVSRFDGRRSAQRRASIAEMITRGRLHYGDPPNIHCCAAGPTMNSVPVRVLEYWQMLDRDLSRVGQELLPEEICEVSPKWERDAELEVDIIRPERRVGGPHQYVIRPVNVKDRDFHLLSNGPRPVAPFSHAVESDGWVILTGQMPTDPDAPDAPLPKEIDAQTQRVMDNLGLILNGIGLDWSHVLQCRAYLTDFDRDFAAFNAVYQSYFPPDRRPARTTVGVTALAVGAMVEIDCMARRP